MRRRNRLQRRAGFLVEPRLAFHARETRRTLRAMAADAATFFVLYAAGLGAVLSHAVRGRTAVRARTGTAP